MDYLEFLKNEIKKGIIERYGRISECGCYSGKDWLSTADIFELVCDVLDENDDIFRED